MLYVYRPIITCYESLWNTYLRNTALESVLYVHSCREMSEDLAMMEDWLMAIVDRTEWSLMMSGDIKPHSQTGRTLYMHLYCIHNICRSLRGTFSLCIFAVALLSVWWWQLAGIVSKIDAGWFLPLTAVTGWIWPQDRILREIVCREKKKRGPIFICVRPVLNDICVNDNCPTWPDCPMADRQVRGDV